MNVAYSSKSYNLILYNCKKVLAHDPTHTRQKEEHISFHINCELTRVNNSQYLKQTYYLLVLFQSTFSDINYLIIIIIYNYYSILFIFSVVLFYTQHWGWYLYLLFMLSNYYFCVLKLRIKHQYILLQVSDSALSKRGYPVFFSESTVTESQTLPPCLVERRTWEERKTWERERENRERDEK